MNWLEKKHLTLKSTIFLLVFFFSSTVKSGPPPYPQDLGTPNILEPILTIGGVYGSELGQFNEPHGVDISDSGQILITDTHNNRICIINPKFQMLNCVKPQKKTEQLNSPMNAKWLSSNQFLVADTGNKRILKLDTNGNILNSTKQNLELNISEPTGLATIDHRIYASDKSNQKVYIFDKDLQLIKSFGVAGDGDGQFVDPSSIATNGRDRLYVADSYNNRIQVFDVDGNFIRKFGDWGSFTGLLANPTSVSYSNNIIFVADLINHRVQGFDEKGNYVLQWGRHPIINHEGNGRLHYPEQIAVSKDGGLAIVCEPFEHRCQVFDILKSTKVVKVDDKAWWDKNGRFHYGARPVASAGLLAISEPDTHSVLVFDIREQTPRFIARVGGQGRDLGSMVKPSGVAISSDGSTLYVSDSGNFRLESYDLKQFKGIKGLESIKPAQKLIRATSTLTLLRDLKKLNNKLDEISDKSTEVFEPSALRVSPLGTILVCDPINGRVLEINQDLTPVRFFIEKPPKELPDFRPNDLAFSPLGDKVYIVDFYHSRVGIFDKDGKFIGTFGNNGTGAGQFVHAFGIAVSNDGTVYVSDEALNRISRFDKEGKFIDSWGSWGAAPGQFYKPKGIAYDKDLNRLIVADFGNHRAQIFDTNGNFISTFGIGQGYVPYILGTSNINTESASKSGSIPSNGGNFIVNYKLETAKPKSGKDYRVEFKVSKYNEDVAESSIKVNLSAVMPSHYHGLSQLPIISRKKDGFWQADGVNFHMPGYWQVYIDIDNGIVVERSQIDLFVE